MIDYFRRMDDSSHVFLIKDKIRCIQKKIMDQLAADLNNALNDANMLTSSMSYVTMTSMNSTKNRRRRKRHNQNDQMQRTNASGSTTPENYGQRLRRRSLDDQDAFLTDPDDIDSVMSSKKFF